MGEVKRKKKQKQSCLEYTAVTKYIFSLHWVEETQFKILRKLDAFRTKGSS